MTPAVGRRGVLAGSLALAACGRREDQARAASSPMEGLDTPTAAPPNGSTAPPPSTPLLRDIAPFPMGTEIITGHMVDPAFLALASSQFSQITPGYEMKMEYVLQPDGSCRWDAPDRIAAFAKGNGQRLYCTTLIWYSQDPAYFQHLDGDRKAFGAAYDRYIQTVMGRYRGQAVGWDTVNEPIEEFGEGLRACRWSQNLGAEDYIVRAFEQARIADPHAVLFLNEYFLEKIPAKRLAFMRLIERLLKRGVPLGGIGNQSHIDIDAADGASTACMRDLASFGLPIHLSELDCSTKGGRLDLRSTSDRLAVQARRYREVMHAFLALPERQRFAFTLWGIRDRDSWMNDPSQGAGGERPLAFDDLGAPKPSFWALADALKGAASPAVKPRRLGPSP